MHYTVLVVGENVEEQLEAFSYDSPEYQVFIPYTQEDFDKFLNTKSYEKSQKEVKENYEKYLKEQNKLGEVPISLLNFWAQYWSDAEPHEGSEYYGHIKNPNAKYDWYEVGGRWNGFFRLKENSNGLKGSQYNYGNLDKATDNADVVQLKDWDIEKSRQDSIEELSKQYDKAQTIIKGRIVPTWPKFDFEDMDLYAVASKQADEYHKNQVIIDLKENGFGPFSEMDITDKFNLPKEQYLEKMLLEVGTTYSLLIDGKWYDSDNTENYHELFWNKLNSLPPETTLTLVDYHN